MRLAVLLSGRGSNFQAIHDAIQRGELPAEIVCVISNRPDAAGLQRAREFGYAAHAIDHKAFANRAAHEEAVLRALDEAKPDAIVLAGYMRLLSAPFIERWRNRIVNIHPSLLPSFPGVDAHLDAGPILVQRVVEVRDDDTGETLAARILVEEHRAYVEALTKMARGGWWVEGRRVVIGD